MTTATWTGSYGAVLLDIEGTTTPISFVYDALFPYARAKAAAWLADHWNVAEVSADVALIGEEAGASVATPEQAAAAVHKLMDGDIKSTGLKSLQGRIWRAGYADGELKGALFADVEPALRAWFRLGVPVCIYSSGSVPAQQLLFAHSEAGDLTPLLAGYYDTRTGPKKVAASYAAIAAAIGRPPATILFATDSLDEAIAAAQAGCQVALSVRPGNHALPAEHGFSVVTSLAPLVDAHA